MSLPISRRAYANMYGPTIGDWVRSTTVCFKPGERIVCGGNGPIDEQLDEAGKKRQALGKISK